MPLSFTWTVTRRRGRRGPRAMSKRGKMNQVRCGVGGHGRRGDRSDEDATDGGVQERGWGVACLIVEGG